MKLGRDASLPGVEQELQNLTANVNDGLCLELRCASSSEDPGGTVGTSEDREGEVARNERNGAMARGRTTADFVQPTAPSCWETADDPIVTRAETLTHHRDMCVQLRGICCTPFQPLWTTKSGEIDTQYRLRPCTVIDLRADMDLLPEAGLIRRKLCLDHGCPIELQEVLCCPCLRNITEETHVRTVHGNDQNAATVAERDLPPISDPYWEHGCALLDIVDDHAHRDNEPERELTERELARETAAQLKSAMQAPWKDIANDLTSRKHEGGGHGRHTADFYAAAIVHAQWRRSKADVVTKETISTLEHNMAAYMEGAFRAWYAWQRFEFERP